MFSNRLDKKKQNRRNKKIVNVGTIHITRLLKTAGILQRMLEYLEDLLSLKFQHKFPIAITANIQ